MLPCPLVRAEYSHLINLEWIILADWQGEHIILIERQRLNKYNTCMLQGALLLENAYAFK